MLSIAQQNMDTTYLSNEFSKGMIDTLKKSMTLEFANRSNTSLLDSPDLKMVQWTTPDLENMIFQQSGLLNMHTPTPGMMRLMSLREDEKPDLRGFDEALAKLHAQRNAESLQQFAESEYSPAPPRNSDSHTMQQIELVYSRAPSKRPFNETIIEDGVSVASKQARFSSAIATNDDDADASCSSSSSSWSEEDDESFSQRSVPRAALSLAGSPRTAAARSSGQHSYAGVSALGASQSKALTSHKHASARSSGSASIPTSSTMQPVDFGSQDRLRVERKRERNRLAARKCRERKIKKIDDLTGQVQKLEGDKKNLAARISRMQAEISRLQTVIQDHAHSGCKIPLGPR